MAYVTHRLTSTTGQVVRIAPRGPSIANCWFPFPTGYEHCPAAPQRKEGRVILPTKSELKTIRRHGERSFQTVNSLPPPTRVEALSSQLTPLVVSTATEGPKRKRGSVVTAHEDVGS